MHCVEVMQIDMLLRQHRSLFGVIVLKVSGVILVSCNGSAARVTLTALCATLRTVNGASC